MWIRTQDGKLKKYEFYCEALEYDGLFKDLLEIFEKLECKLDMEYKKEEFEDEYDGWCTYATEIRIKNECLNNCRFNYACILTGFGFDLKEVAE